MPILRTAIALTGWTSLGSALSYTLWTRHSRVLPIPSTDYIFGTTLFARFNPYNNPVTQDICLRRVPISKIKPGLLEGTDAGDGKLVTEFCRGLWSGWGYAYQRRYLEKKYRGPETAGQLWERQDLASSDYKVGTQITDHFEVVAKTPSSIIVRCGDSPRIAETRASDGLFEMLVDIKKDEGVVEFGLKSVFYNGLAQPNKEGKEKGDGPMSPWIQWLHAHYDKILMETAVRRYPYYIDTTQSQPSFRQSKNLASSSQLAPSSQQPIFSLSSVRFSTSKHASLNFDFIPDVMRFQRSSAKVLKPVDQEYSDLLPADAMLAVSLELVEGGEE